MIVLFHDTLERFLAIEIREFCTRLGLDLKMISREPNDSHTLEEKEDRYFDDCEAAIFLLTPRKTDGSISTSVSIEVGRAKEKFRGNPEKIIYFADATCDFSSIDQKPRNTFQRNDLCSIVQALSIFLGDLRRAGLNPNLPWESGREKPGQVDMLEIQRTPKLAETIEHLSEQKDGIIKDSEFDLWLQSQGMNHKFINRLKREMVRQELAVRDDIGTSQWKLIDRGWELADKLAQQKAIAIKKMLVKIGVVKSS